MQPNTQNQAPSLLDPDTLQAVAQQMSGGDSSAQAVNTQNILQLYKQAINGLANGYTTDSQGNSLVAYKNMCEQYLENQVYGKSGMYATAQDAANAYASKGQLKPGLQGIKPGDPVYFGSNSGNSYDGHGGVFIGYDAQGNPLMKDNNSNGTQVNNINTWNQNVAPLLGYVPVK